MRFYLTRRANGENDEESVIIDGWEGKNLSIIWPYYVFLAKKLSKEFSDNL